MNLKLANQILDNATNFIQAQRSELQNEFDTLITMPDITAPIVYIKDQAHFTRFIESLQWKKEVSISLHYDGHLNVSSNNKLKELVKGVGFCDESMQISCMLHHLTL